MSGEASIGSQFRDALIECKRLYISAAREMLDQQGEKREAVRHDRIRRMVDLHKGLAVKIYAQVVKADRHWAPEEQELARILIDHLWQQQLDGAALREATGRLFHDAGDLKWYGLVRLFDEVPVLRDAWRTSKRLSCVWQTWSPRQMAGSAVTRPNALAEFKVRFKFCSSVCRWMRQTKGAPMRRLPGCSQHNWRPTTTDTPDPGNRPHKRPNKL